MKFKQWRDAVVKHLFVNGPASIETLDSELKNKEGLRWSVKPTNKHCQRLLKLDKRIVQVGVDLYSVNLEVLKEIKWERW
tara:strand:+ start:431 stop:670 length:240 start_codon:yes stop_codon:yes gene_type:complete